MNGDLKVIPLEPHEIEQMVRLFNKTDVKAQYRASLEIPGDLGWLVLSDSKTGKTSKVYVDCTSLENWYDLLASAQEVTALRHENLEY